MAKRYELIVFDWDGTLLDSAGAIVASIQAAARDIGVEPPDEERARHIIGLGLADALRHALPDLDTGRYRELAECYRDQYLARDHELSLFEGIEALLEELSAGGFLLAVATGKSRRGLERALDMSGLRPRFLATRCADECHSKPHPQMLEELMAEFSVAPEATLMIGDTTHDLLMARNAGIDAIGVVYGAHSRALLEDQQPVYLAESVTDLARWLRENA